MVRGTWSACRAAITPKPSTSGICTSRKTRSGFSCLISAMADLPSPHSATICRSGSSSNILRKSSRASDSSSLSNTRMDIGGHDLLGAFAERYVNFDDAASAGLVLQGHPVIVVVQLLQAGARVAQPHAFWWNAAAMAGQPLAVVADLHPQLIEDLASRDANPSGGEARAYAMANGILHQRLQNQVRDQGRSGVRLDIHFHPQAVLEACLLDVNIFLQEGQLATERHLVDADRVERQAQQVRQLQSHVFGGGTIVSGQGGDGIQGIEQEVRFQLNLQRLELRISQLGFQLRGLQLALPILAVIPDRLGNQQDIPVALEIHEGAGKSVR